LLAIVGYLPNLNLLLASKELNYGPIQRYVGYN
jgi:hypothetical protein